MQRVRNLLHPFLILCLDVIDHGERIVESNRGRSAEVTDERANVRSDC
jgi:hypothetical protein